MEARVYKRYTRVRRDVGMLLAACTIHAATGNQQITAGVSSVPLRFAEGTEKGRNVG